MCGLVEEVGGSVRDTSLQLGPSRAPLAGNERLWCFCCLFNSCGTRFCSASVELTSDVISRL